MKITKFEHACFVLEKDAKSLVVDPGDYTSDFVVPENVVAIIVTHEHQDHLSEDLIRRIIDKNQDAVIVGHADVVAKLGDYKLQVVEANTSCKIGPFDIAFFGGVHATIHPDLPTVANLGVMINDTLYYPGDSLTLPLKPVDVLALPIAAPWMKLSEAVDYVRALKPKRIFPTHDAILSDGGKDLADRLIPALTKSLDIHYERIKEPTEL